MAVSIDSRIVVVLDFPMEEDHLLGQPRQLCPCAPHFLYFFLRRASPVEGIQPFLGLPGCLLCTGGSITICLTYAGRTQENLLMRGLMGGAYAYLTQSAV